MEEGLPKLWLIAKTLDLRRESPGLFAGDYKPLYATGASVEHVVAFLRNGRLIAIAPRLTAEGDSAFSDASLTLPAGRWHNWLTGTFSDGGEQTIAALLRDFPVALLVKDKG
jgi:(1->4)-alpha-D-glucan 1-alpha-D-glucosylmutase